MKELMVKTMICSVALGCLLALRAETQTYLPQSDTFVHVNEPNGLHRGLVADSFRDSLMRLDVGGMENVTNATLRLYVTQHSNSDYKPVILRQMNDVDWLESDVTLNAMAHEFPNGLTAMTASDDPTVIGYCAKIPGLNQWAEFDITKAVKREAVRSGKLAFVISTMAFRGFSNNPTCFASSGHADPAFRPQFVVSWAEGESRGTARKWVCCPVTDEFTIENSGTTIRVDGAYLANGSVREAFFKFDLSALVGQGHVRRAVIRFPQYEFTNPRSTKAYINYNTNDTWTEADYPAGNRGSRVYPSGLTKVSSPGSNSISCKLFGGSWQTNFVNETEITAFVRDAVAKGRNSLSLSMISTSKTSDGKGDTYVIGASRRNTKNVPPVQIWVDMAETEDGPAATPEWAYDSQESRPLIHFACVNNFSNKDINSCSSNSTETTIQTGSADLDKAKRLLTPFFLFDPKGLENTPYVRLRVKIQRTTNPSAGRRLYGCVTPFWECEKVTWNNMIREFASTCVEVIKRTDVLPNHLFAIGHNFGTPPEGQSFAPYMENDVTELVHSAARQGKYVTFMLGTVDNSGWTWLHSDKADARPRLVYPAIRGFANQLSATTGTAGDGHKTAVIAWTPSRIGGATYAVSRRMVGRPEEETLAQDLTEATYTDAEARSDRDYVYTVTATLPDETVQTATFTNRIDNTVTVTNVLDGFVRNGDHKKDTASWKSYVIVMKDGDGGMSDSNLTREGFFRFALADVPDRVRRVTLKLRNGIPSDCDKDETLYLRVVNDIDRTDDNPPTWTDLLGDALGATSATAPGIFYSRFFGTDPLTPYGEHEINVTAQVKAAKQRGDSHILFHIFARDPDKLLNFGFETKESPYTSSAPRLICEKPSWTGALVIFVR